MWWFFLSFENFISNLFSLPFIVILLTSFHWSTHSRSITYTIYKDLLDIKFHLLLSHLLLIILYFSPSLLGGCNLINLLSLLSLICSPRLMFNLQRNKSSKPHFLHWRGRVCSGIRKQKSSKHAADGFTFHKHWVQVNSDVTGFPKNISRFSLGMQKEFLYLSFSDITGEHVVSYWCHSGCRWI